MPDAVRPTDEERVLEQPVERLGVIPPRIQLVEVSGRLAGIALTFSVRFEPASRILVVGVEPHGDRPTAVGGRAERSPDTRRRGRPSAGYGGSACASKAHELSVSPLSGELRRSRSHLPERTGEQSSSCPSGRRMNAILHMHALLDPRALPAALRPPAALRGRDSVDADDAKLAEHLLMVGATKRHVIDHAERARGELA